MNSSPPYRPMRSLVAQVLGDRLRHAAQDDVAGSVAVRVVDRLEVVDIDERDAQRPLIARCALDLGEQGGEEGLAIDHAGQAVDRRPVVRVGEGRRDAVDGIPEPRLETAAAARDGDGVVAGDDPLGGRDEPPEADPDDDPGQRGRERDADHHRGHSRRRSRWSPPAAHHEVSPGFVRKRSATATGAATAKTPSRRITPRRLRVRRAPSDRPDVPAERAGSTAHAAPEVWVTAADGSVRGWSSCYTPAVLDTSGSREPGGQRSRFQGASAAP